MPTDIIPISYIRIGEVDHPIDAVTVGGKTLEDLPAALPALSNEDEEKIMMVLQGQWTMTSASTNIYNIINGLPCPGGDTGDSDSDSDSGEHDYPNEYLTFEVLTPGNIAWKSNGTVAQTIQYSKNNGEWTSITAAATPVTIPVVAGDVVRFKGTNSQYGLSKDNFSGFGDTTYATATYNIYGNIMSLLYGDNFQGQTTITKQYAFFSLFDGSGVVSAENLILPTMTMVPHCYRALFANCSYFTTAPALPATTLAESCYRFMFNADNVLTSVPEILPATTLYKECYYGMFNGCTSITTAPELPATTLTTSCYKQMFMNCSNLTYIKCLATNISVGSPTTDWVKYVAASGTFVKSHEMSSWTVGASGIPTGWVATDDIITVSDPVISFANNTITITCSTTGAVIYYRLGTTGSFQVYSSPIEIGEDTYVEAYASISDVDSSTVTYDCTYVPDEGDSDSDSDYGDSDSEVPGLHDYSLDYLTFNVLTGGNILWKSIGSGQAKTISYSINDGAWTSITATSGGTAIPVSAGDVVRFKGTNSTYAKDKSNYSGFDGGTATYNVEGNMMSLIYGDNFVGNNTLSGTYNFCSIFKQSKAVSAENMILPATTLTNYCYRAMFSLAPNLIAPPALPATTLAQGCYWYMFEKCPMSTAPDLLAPTLVQECYGNMFTGCSNLNYIKCLATTKSATNCLQNWVSNVAATGTFVKDANTTWTTGTSGIPTGWVVYDGEIVEDPVINFNGENKIEISCETSGATIYYRLGNSGNYSVYTGPITITEDVTVYTYAEKDGQQSQTVNQECVYSEHIYKFGDLVFASGPLYYGNDGYEIKDSWNYSSYGTVYGKTVGSTFFNFIEMGDLFKKSGFSSSDGQILNTLDPLDGWRLPTKDEWDYIVGSTRPGSTVNGSTNKHYAFINFIHDNDVNTVNLHGVLIFPDNETITGAALTYMDSGGTTQDLTLEQFNNYLSQGCIFLHNEGFAQTGSGFSAGNNYLGYWSSSEGSSSSVAYILTDQGTLTTSNYSKSNGYLPVYLVRDTTYGEETPLEGATKSLNTWTI